MEKALRNVLILIFAENQLPLYVLGPTRVPVFRFSGMPFQTYSGVCFLCAKKEISIEPHVR